MPILGNNKDLDNLETGLETTLHDNTSKHQIMKLYSALNEFRAGCGNSTQRTIAQTGRQPAWPAWVKTVRREQAKRSRCLRIFETR